MNRKKNTLPSRSTPRRPGEQGPRTVSLERGEDEVLGSAGGTGSRPKEPQRNPAKKHARFADNSDDSSSGEERVTTRRRAKECSSGERECVKGSDDEKKAPPTLKPLYSLADSDLCDESLMRRRRPAKAPAGTKVGLKMSLLTDSEREAILNQERELKALKKTKRKRGIQKRSHKKSLKQKKKGGSGDESETDEIGDVPEATSEPGSSKQEPMIKSDDIPVEEIQLPTPTHEPEQAGTGNTPEQTVIVNLELVQVSMELQEPKPKAEKEDKDAIAEEGKDAIAMPSEQAMKVAEGNNREGIQEDEPTPEQAPQLAPGDKEPDSDDESAAKRPKESE